MTDKKIALVTGASKGLGFETARQLAERDFYVLVGARDAAKAGEAAAKLAAFGLAAEGLALDVASSASIGEAADSVAARFGRLDVLVNNAAINLDGDDFSRTVVSEADLHILRQTFDANFFGLVETTQRFLPLIRKSAAGRIVNVSSILGSLTLHADPASPIYGSKLFAYNVSKTAVNQFTVHLAYELRDTPVKVNSAHPGWVQTDMGGSAAPMTVQDGAKTMVWLATLGPEGPTGGYFHDGQSLPW
jgi:NAD(P)-dependent dehydrogenase (short-subunit alcohol dehydrogenase family)